MPVRLRSKLPPETLEARIEIIPLIDIMFFLLAAFMLVSLSLARVKSLPVTLPAAAAAQAENPAGLASVSVDKSGLIWLDGRPAGAHELREALAARRKTNSNLRVLVSGDTLARHGDIITVLDAARLAGVEHVAFQIRPPPAPQP